MIILSILACYIHHLFISLHHISIQTYALTNHKTFKKKNMSEESYQQQPLILVNTKKDD